MTIITGSAGNDTYTGIAGTADAAIINALQASAQFSWQGDKWSLPSAAGNDTLISVEQVQFTDAVFQLRGAGRFLLGTSQTAGNGQPGSVARLGDGSFIHTFAAFNSNTGSYDIVGKRYSAAGDLVGSQFTVNSALDGNQIAPDVAVLTTGDYVITWQAPDTTGPGVYLQRFSAAGVAQGAELHVNTTNTFDEATSSITALTGGRYLVTWESSGADGSGSGVYGQIYTSAGAPSGGEFRVSTSTVGTQGAVSVAALSDGGFAATYLSNFTLMFQRFTASGVVSGNEVTLAQSISSQAVAVLPGDKVVVASVESNAVKIMTLDATGLVTLAEKSTINNTSGAAGYPSIATLSDGGFVVAWFAGNALRYDLHVQRFDSSGSEVGGDDILVSNIDAFNASLEIAPDVAGGYAIQWSDRYNNVQALRVDADNLPVLASVTGDEAANIITGYDGSSIGLRFNGLQGNDRIVAGSFGDILDGGEGNDTLIGGNGNDTYIAGQEDRIIEAANGGIDTVLVRESYVLSARNVENISIRGALAANVTGNLLDNVITGNKADNVINGGRGADTMSGNGGNDTYVADNIADKAIERPGEGIDTVVTTVNFTLDANLENLRANGSNDVSLTGNAADNLIVGNNGDNTITGGGGSDVLDGKGGNDAYNVDAQDVVIERVGGGIDTVGAGISWVLDENVENLVLTGNGPTNGTGNALANVITGNAASNIIDGGTGADRMDGGGGSDIYIVDNIGDVAIDSGSAQPGAVDEVRSSVDFTIDGSIENLTLTGYNPANGINGFGNNKTNIIRGNEFANLLDGGASAPGEFDKLYGYGGADQLYSQYGTSELYGGIGNDGYHVTGDGDLIVELANQGIDVIYASIVSSYELPENVEKLVLTSNGVKDADSRATGNNLDNTITGNLGANIIDGGSGVDTMTGNAGDDTYFIDNRSDVVIEAANEGDDTIYSSVGLIVAANVENLHLTGSATINGTGNALDNTIYGNTANNVLNGGLGDDVISGGDGNDTLQGSGGRDILVGGTGNDLIDGGADVDTVNYRRATANITVNLTVLTAQATGAGSDTISGVENVDGSNTGNDTLTGDGASNRLYGMGGDDTLVGGAGDDVLLGGEGADTLLGGLGNDRIDGGNGIDLVTFQSVAGDVTVFLSPSVGRETGEGIDTIQNVENATGSATGNDSLTGDIFANTLSGLGGNDTLTGGDGADVLDGGDGTDTASYFGAFDDVIVDLGRAVATDDFGAKDTLISIENIRGGEFDDTLSGSAGNNVITGDLGRDVLRGGGGNDTFAYRFAADTGITATTRDLILDWAVGDKLDLAQIDANSVTAGDQAFTFIGTAAYSSVAGQLRQQTVSGQTFIEGDIDGNGVSDFSIAIKGIYVFHAADFTL